LEVSSLKTRRRNSALQYNMDKQLIEAGKRTRFVKGRKLTKEIIEKIRIGHNKKIRNKKIRGGEIYG